MFPPRAPKDPNAVSYTHLDVYKRQDYFSAKAQPYLTNLIDKYADAGVKLNALYSDEMHIQQDWNYFGHHDNGEFTLRYMTDNMAVSYTHLDVYKRQCSVGS